MPSKCDTVSIRLPFINSLTAVHGIRTHSIRTMNPKPFLFIAFAATCHAVLASGNSPEVYPQPASPATGKGDCSFLIVDMANCVSYLSNGSNDTKPDSACCLGLQTVLKSNAGCLCAALNNTAGFGIDLNMSRAVSLPAACHVTSPPITKCDGTKSASLPPSSSPTPRRTAPASSTPKSPAPSSSSASYMIVTMATTSLIYLSV
ncbi:hypothetical protein Nepgr_019299 [Nepenthes gracilis]|uniref:Bifunctional inhibitor/plant lipid transfer protein/seed storage helical domain-containing protein n=1 Tax=Nepenthes gracilis TaxID=150966 RepID=A0AAD3XU87_NEPGR|nr:hypothetical protein Nepgr_019299 [Nepenthes gracilis]